MRYSERPLPPYRYRPGRSAHPTRHPEGHAYGTQESAEPELARFDGPMDSPGARVGTSSLAADLDGDGTDDLVLGAPGVSSAAIFLTAHSGSVGWDEADLELFGEQPDDSFGHVFRFLCFGFVFFLHQFTLH